MKTYHINILGFDKPAAVMLAGFISDALRTLNSTGDTYVPRIYLRSDGESQEEFEEALGQKFSTVDVTISIGIQMTQLLVGRGLPLIFIAVPEPVTVGVVDSLEIPGRMISGVCMADPSPTRQVSQLEFLSPYAKRILILYNPEGLGGTQEGRVSAFTRQLETVDVEVGAYRVYSPLEAFKVARQNVGRFDIVLLMEGCQTTADAHFSLAKLCAASERILMSGAGFQGIVQGAALSYGSPSNVLIPPLINLVDRYCRERFDLGVFPVFRLPDQRKLYINRFMLPWLPFDLLKYIMINHSEPGNFFWVGSRSQRREEW